MTDILLDENLTPLITDGDLTIGDSTSQNQMLLLVSDKGEFKQFPTRGVGVARYIETSDSEGLAREINTEYRLDGMTVDKVKVNIPDVQIEAYYE